MKTQLSITRVLLWCTFLLSRNANAQPLYAQPGENIWHLAASVATEVDQFSATQSNCCVETFTTLDVMNSKLDLLATQGCDLSGTLTVLENITAIQDTTISIIDTLSIVVADNFAGTFTVIASLSSTDASSTYTALNALIKQEIQTQSHLDNCCSSISSKLDLLELIDNSCTSSAIAQTDVLAGVLTLTTTGQKYCLSQNITASVSIVAPDITFDLNDYTVNGIIAITATANRTIVENGKVIPTIPPTSNTLATNGAVQAQAPGVQLLNLQIQCPASTGNTSSNGLNGLSGIRVENSNILIENCQIISGAGANGLTATSGGTGGASGVGIDLAAGSDNARIIESSVITGIGGNGAASSASHTPGTGIGGASGNGINVLSNNVLIVKTAITTGNGGIGANGAVTNDAASAGGASGIGINSSSTLNTGLVVSYCIIRTGVGGKGGDNPFSSILITAGASGIGVNNSASLSIIENCFIVTGTGGQGGDAAATRTGGMGGASGIGINNNAIQNVVIQNNHIETGLGGNGGLSSSNTLMTGSGGQSGIGISNTSANSQITHNIIATLSGGMGGNMVTNNSGAAGRGSSSGQGINNSGVTVVISENIIQVASGGNGGAVNSTSGTQSAGFGGASGVGISNSGNFSTITRNDITISSGGNGGNNNNPTGGNNNAAGNGGAAISISGNAAVISYNVLRSGNGGNGGALVSSGFGGVAGAGGNGIEFTAGDGSIALNNTIEKTGIGGNGGVGGSGAGTRGGGGHGIFIGTAPTHTQIGTNIISNTGTFGTGSGSTIAGYAVNDTATTASPNASVIYSNFAYNIANTSPSAYNISANSTATSGASVGIASSTNSLDNVHAP